MTKIKVNYEEGFNTFISKEYIEIDTNNYPELDGLSEDEISDYLQKNASSMKSTDGDEPNRYSLFDEIYEQEDAYSKEKNNESFIRVEFVK
jgi:hypothetical protein